MTQITTIKLDKRTKARLEKLREHKRETYDEIIRKMLYVLGLVRTDSGKAIEILERVDELRGRMVEMKELKRREKNN